MKRGREGVFTQTVTRFYSRAEEGKKQPDTTTSKQPAVLPQEVSIKAFSHRLFTLRSALVATKEPAVPLYRPHPTTSMRVFTNKTSTVLQEDAQGLTSACPPLVGVWRMFQIGEAVCSRLQVQGQAPPDRY